MDITEPEITRDDVLILDDPDFTEANACLVTGCGTGIGRAVSFAAAVKGLTVFSLDINAQEGEKTCEKAGALGGKMIFEKTDLTDDAAVEALLTRAAGIGQIKYLANIAGIQHILLRAPFFLSKLTILHMKQSADGRGVANMASVHAHICTKNKPVYNITKFGLKALSQSISAEGKIPSFTVSSGFVKTTQALNPVAAQAEQRGITPEEVVSDVMMGKSRVKEMMSRVKVANLFIHGFSRFSKYLVGGDLLFDGGMVLTY